MMTKKKHKWTSAEGNGFECEHCGDEVESLADAEVAGPCEAEALDEMPGLNGKRVSRARPTYVDARRFEW